MNFTQSQRQMNHLFEKSDTHLQTVWILNEIVLVQNIRMLTKSLNVSQWERSFKLLIRNLGKRLFPS